MKAEGTITGRLVEEKRRKTAFAAKNESGSAELTEPRKDISPRDKEAMQSRRSVPMGAEKIE